MVGQVGFADLAAVDALRVQVDVVGEAHPGGGWALGLRRGDEGGTFAPFTARVIGEIGARSADELVVLEERIESGLAEWS